jgi:hypothetical protein
LIAAALTLAFATAGAQAAQGAHGSAAAAGGGHSPAARKGDNGTVKIHRSGTPVTDPADQPHVCVFYLDAFGFDPAQSVTWQIKSWPPTGNRTVVSSGTLTLNSGNGFTSDMTLANGHYKLYWNFTGEHGFAKQKVFWVKCAPPTSPPPTSPPPTSSPPTSSPPTSPAPSPAAGAGSASSSPPPGGGLPVTGEPLALIGGTGLGLLATGGAATLWARRRRGYGR